MVQWYLLSLWAKHLLEVQLLGGQMKYAKLILLPQKQKTKEVNRRQSKSAIRPYSFEDMNSTFVISRDFKTADNE